MTVVSALAKASQARGLEGEDGYCATLTKKTRLRLAVAKFFMAFFIAEIYTRSLAALVHKRAMQLLGFDAVAVLLYFIVSGFPSSQRPRAADFEDGGSYISKRAINTALEPPKVFVNQFLAFMPSVSFIIMAAYGSEMAMLAKFVWRALVIGESCYSWQLWYPPARTITSV